MSPVKSAWEKDTQRGAMRQVYPAMSYRRALAALILYAHKVRDEIAREWRNERIGRIG
jgi:hypothetical protein